MTLAASRVPDGILVTLGDARAVLAAPTAAALGRRLLDLAGIAPDPRTLEGQTTIRAAILAARGDRDVAAAALGVSLRTLQRWTSKYPTILALPFGRILNTKVFCTKCGVGTWARFVCGSVPVCAACWEKRGEFCSPRERATGQWLDK